MVKSKSNEQLELFNMADEFITAANRLVQEHKQEIERVGTALRYAAARFNAYEASFKSDNLEKDKTDALSWFTEQYRLMLLENLEDHIEMQKTKNGQQT